MGCAQSHADGNGGVAPPARQQVQVVQWSETKRHLGQVDGVGDGDHPSPDLQHPPVPLIAGARVWDEVQDAVALTVRSGTLLLHSPAADTWSTAFFEVVQWQRGTVRFEVRYTRSRDSGKWEQRLRPGGAAQLRDGRCSSVHAWARGNGAPPNTLVLAGLIEQRSAAAGAETELIIGSRYEAALAAWADALRPLVAQSQPIEQVGEETLRGKESELRRAAAAAQPAARSAKVDSSVNAAKVRTAPNTHPAAGTADSKQVPPTHNAGRRTDDCSQAWVAAEGGAGGGGGGSFGDGSTATVTVATTTTGRSSNSSVTSQWPASPVTPTGLNPDREWARRDNSYNPFAMSEEKRVRALREQMELLGGLPSSESTVVQIRGPLPKLWSSDDDSSDESGDDSVTGARRVLRSTSRGGLGRPAPRAVNDRVLAGKHPRDARATAAPSKRSLLQNLPPI
jgi:hypothetical protein